MNKNLIYQFLIFTLFIGVSCNDDSDQIDNTPYDHESQIPIDQAKLYTYFEEHYITESGELLTIPEDGLPSGETLLSDDPKLDSITGIVANNTVTNYKMYYYVTQEGSDASEYGNPSPVDSVFVKYKGMLLDGTVFDSKTDFPRWFRLTEVVKGWSRGFTRFNRGALITLPDDDFEFENQGKGFLFFPSGLGYQNFAQLGIPANSPLVFQIELDDVNLVDTDRDGVPTKYEITIDESGNYSFYDFDQDGFDDYNDIDDDNDQVLTRDEVAKEFPDFDPDRGYRLFEYGENGEIAAKGSTTTNPPNGDNPNYKNAAIK